MTDTALPAHVPLAVATRGAHVENVHAGSLVVTDAAGQLVYAAGDAAFPVFARSTLKPFQALPFVAAGGLDRFGWGGREAAMLCASHSAEDVHLEIVRRMLEGSGHGVDDLGCGAHVPMHYAANGTSPAADAHWTPLHNNCSGKHAGFLACCALHGWPHDECLEPAHPLQAAIRDALGELAAADIERAPHGIDGCSAPVFAISLVALARAYAQLAIGAPGTRWAPAAGRLRDAMRDAPELVSGSGRFDLALARQGAGDWVVKSGADGVQAVASMSRGQALALKLADGNARIAHAVTLAALRQLGWLDGLLSPELAAFAGDDIRNWRGTVTGHLRALLPRA